MDLTAIFGKFAGREVPLIEKPYKIKTRYFGIIEGTNTFLADENDKTLQEMRDEARKHGLTLRVFWPGVTGTMEYKRSRVNAHLEQGDDGKWRVGSRFNIG